MNPLRVLALALLLLAPPAVAQDAEPPVNLRPQWTVGQAAAYDFWTRSEKHQVTEAFGQTQSESTVYVSEGRTAWTVDQVNDDGSAVCTMQVRRIKMTITPSEGEVVELDSENPSGEIPMFDQFLAAVVSTPLTVRVNADGSIDGVDGADEVARKAGEEATDVVPDELDFIQSASELATLIAAPARASVGDTWDAQNTWNQDNILPGTKATADWDTAFTLASVGPIEGVPIASVNARSTLDIKVDLSDLPPDAPKVEVRVSDAVGSSEVLYDLSRHETVGRNDSVRFTVDVTIPMPRADIPPATIHITEKSQSQLLRVQEE